MAYEWMTVQLDGYGSIPAYADPSVEWNGFRCPYFRAEDVSAINIALHEFTDEQLIYDANTDAFNCVGADGKRIERFVGRDVDGVRLYPIGNGCWIWTKKEEW